MELKLHLKLRILFIRGGIMRRILKSKYFKWLLVIIWMMVIFSFSNEPAVVSDEKSNMVINILNYLGIDLNSVFGELANFIVRKGAHFTEYAVLFLLLNNALKDSLSMKNSLLAAILITFLYACSDEFHQTFISGREGKIRDVLIDTSGGAAVLLILYIKTLVLGKRKKNSAKSDIS
jgi:VanZ family protein